MHNEWNLGTNSYTKSEEQNWIHNQYIFSVVYWFYSVLVHPNFK